MKSIHASSAIEEEISAKATTDRTESWAMAEVPFRRRSVYINQKADLPDHITKHYHLLLDPLVKANFNRYFVHVMRRT